MILQSLTVYLETDEVLYVLFLIIPPFSFSCYCTVADETGSRLTNCTMLFPSALILLHGQLRNHARVLVTQQIELSCNMLSGHIFIFAVCHCGCNVLLLLIGQYQD